MSRSGDATRWRSDPAAYLIAGVITWLADGTPLDIGGVLDSSDADVAVRVVSRHGLAPALYSALAATYPDARTRWPWLWRIYLSSGARNALVAERLRECLAALNSEGIRAIPFKGNDYVLRLYTDAGHRRVSDLDLLVRDEEVNAALRSLGSLGYVRAATAFSAEEEWLSLRYLGGVLMTRGRDLPLDVHTSVLRGYGERDRAMAEIWEHAKRVEDAGEDVEFMRLEHAFIVSALHLYSNWHRSFPYLKDAADLVLISRTLARDGDWETMWAAARAWGVEREVRSVAAMLNRDLDGRVPGCRETDHGLRLADLVHPEQIIRNTGRISEGLAARLRLMGHLPSVQARVRYLIGFLLPRAEYLRWRFRCDDSVPVWRLRLRHIRYGTGRLVSDVLLRFVAPRRRRLNPEP